MKEKEKLKELIFDPIELNTFTQIKFEENNFDIIYRLWKFIYVGYYVFVTIKHNRIEYNNDNKSKILIAFKSFERFYNYMVFQHLKD